MNQYRCETCNHFVGKMANYFGVDQPFCKNPKMIEYFKSLPKDPGCTPDHQSCWIPSHIIREGDLNFAPLSRYDVERIGVLGCASHSDYQSERDAHWRDLFVSDLRSSIKWDAEHGNPELFKVVVTLDKHYNTFSVEQHDKQVRDKVLDEVIAKWREWHHAGYERPIQRETVVKLFEELRQAGSP